MKKYILHGSIAASLGMQNMMTSVFGAHPLAPSPLSRKMANKGQHKCFLALT